MECGSKPSFGETNSRKKALFYAQESAYISIECNIVEDIIDALRQAVSDAEDVCSEYDDVIGNVPENFADRISELEEGKEATESWIVVLEDAISEIETINEETSDEENENEEEEDLIDRAKTLATDAISALEI
jgi:TATA-binding protein-associated factor Taf7